MQPIKNTLTHFTKALEQKQIITCDAHQGRWSNKASIWQRVKYYLGFDEERLLSIGKAFCKTLDHFEQIPVVYNSETTTIAQRDYTASLLLAANHVEATLNSSTDIRIRYQLNEVARRVAALKYRMEPVNGGIAPLLQPTLNYFEQIKNLVAQWKNNEPFWLGEEVTERDQERIKEICTFPEFAKILLKDDSLQDLLFNWCIRENNSVRQFIEYPGTMARIKVSLLSSRISRFGGHCLKIHHQPVPNLADAFQKVLTLPFHIDNKVEHINILDEDQIVNLRGDMQMTIKKVFQVFANKKLVPGDLEFFGTLGITNWNAYELGWLDKKSNSYVRVDFLKPKWWEDLPVLEEISFEDIQHRYGKKIEEGEWIVLIRAARQTKGMDPDGQHGFFEIAIPLGNNRYAVYPFGVFPENFPTSFLNRLGFLAATVIAKIGYPDENHLYSHRQYATFVMRLTKDEGTGFLKIVGSDVIDSIEGNLTLQLGYDNCAAYPQKRLTELFGDRIPNFFMIKTLEAQPSNPFLKLIYRNLKKVSPQWQGCLLNGLQTILGSGRGIYIKEKGKFVFKSVKTNPLHEQQLIFQPGFLHHQIETGKLPGFMSFGPMHKAYS